MTQEFRVVVLRPGARPVAPPPPPPMPGFAPAPAPVRPEPDVALRERWAQPWPDTPRKAESPGPPRRSWTDTERSWVAGLCVVAGLAAILLAPAAPTGVVPADALYRAGLAAVVVLLTLRARRFAWLGCAGVICVATANSAWEILAVAGLAASLGAALGRRPGPAVRAGVGLVLAQGLLHLDFPRTTGATALLVVGVLAALARSGGRLRSASRRRVRPLILGFAAFLALGTLGALASLLMASGPALAGVRQAEAGLSAARAGNSAATSADLAAAAASLNSARSRIDAPWARLGELVPGLAQNFRVLRVLAEQGQHAAAQSASLASAVDPAHLAVDHGTLDTDALAAVVPAARAGAATLAAAGLAISRTHSVWELPPLAHGIDHLVIQTGQVGQEETLLGNAAQQLPPLLGAKSTRHYLVAVLDTAEDRGGGGLFTAFLVLNVAHGHFSVARVGTDLDLHAPPGGAVITGPADYLSRYSRFNPQVNLIDTFYSPDFPTDAQVVMQSFPQFGGQNVDGVIGVDAAGLAGLLQLSGPVTVPGWPVPVSAANAVPILLHDQYVAYAAPDQSARKAFLVQLARAIFAHLTDQKLAGPSALAQVFGPLVRGRHLQIYSGYHNEETLLDSVGASGRMTPALADYLDVTTQNSSNDKADWYMRRSITYAAHRDSTGLLRATMNLSINSTEPAAGQPGYVIGGGPGMPTPAGLNLEWVSVYSPFSLSSADIDGAPVAMSEGVESGHNVYSAFLRVPPGGQSRLQINLVGTMPPGMPYSLQYDAQPTPNPDHVRISVANGGSTQVLFDGPVSGNRLFS